MKLLSLSSLALALLFSHTASAAPQSTATMETDTSTSIPRACAKIANSPRVPGCTSEEFAERICSPGCASALKKLQSDIVDACEGVSGGGSVVDASLGGELVERVCSEGIEEDDDDETGGAAKTSAGGPASPSVTPPAGPTPGTEEGKEVERERERPNGAGGSPFDIVAEGVEAGSGRVGAEWVSAAVAFGAMLLAAR